MAKKKIDTELERILGEFAAVNYNRIKRTRSTKGAIASQARTVREYANRINGWNSRNAV